MEKRIQDELSTVLEKIFILIPWFSPAFKAGGPIQSIANLVDTMGAAEEMEFYIFCGNKDLDGTVLHTVAHDQWVIYNENTKVWYSSQAAILPVLLREIKIHSPAVLYINGIFSWHYTLKPLLYTKNIQKIVAARGMLNPGALSQKSFKKKIYLGLWKLLGLTKSISWQATNAEEETHIKTVFGKEARVKIAANFPRIIKSILPIQSLPGTLSMISVGIISPMKNYSLVLDGLKEIKNESLQIDYHIYGAIKDNAYYNACLEKIKDLPKSINVAFKGEIPATEIETVLAKASLFILPSKSENFGHAIMEALLSGRPVITSHTTPWNNLEQAKAGININPEQPTAIANAIRFFASLDPAAMEEWSRGAREYALKAVEVEEVKEGYRRLFCGSK